MIIRGVKKINFLILKNKIVEIKNKFKSDELAKNGLVMFSSSLIAGVCNYIYQVYMGRILGPGEYGIFGALFAIFYMILIISQALSTSTTRFISKFVGEGKKIGFFIKGSLKRMIIIGLIISILFNILSFRLVDIFKLKNYYPLLVLSSILFLAWISPVIEGGLRGLKLFNRLGFVYISSAFFKLFFGISLVILGFGVSGALMGVTLGTIFSLMLSIIYIKPYLLPNNPHEPDFRFRNFYQFALPVMLAITCYSVIGNLDVIIANYYFSAVEAGIYNSIAVLGKIILFIPGGIGMVMFTMVTEKFLKKERVDNILKKSILFTGILSGSVMSTYLLFPGIVVKIFGNRYINAVGLVGYYGVIMFFLAMIGILINYHLAIKNNRYIVSYVLFTIMEIILLIIFHSSIIQMIKVMLIINFIFLIVSMIYTIRLSRYINN